MFECGTHNKIGRKSSQKRVHKVMSGTDEKGKHKEMNRTDGVLLFHLGFLYLSLLLYNCTIDLMLEEHV